ncbi:MAG: hypothetical protein AAGD01_08810 [Acidobacteriota bacterium]
MMASSSASSSGSASAFFLLRSALSLARRSPLLVLTLYLAPLVPALALGQWLKSALGRHIDRYLYSEGLAGGRVLDVLVDVMADPDAGPSMQAILGTTSTLVIFGWLLRLLATAAVAGRLVDVRTLAPGQPPRLGLGQQAVAGFFPLLRAAVARWVLSAPAILVFLLVLAPFRAVTASSLDERWQFWGFFVALLIALPLYLWARWATHLSVADALAQGGDRRSFRGSFRAARGLLRRLRKPLILGFFFVFTALLLHWLHFALLGTAVALGSLGAFVLQQLIFLARAGLEVSWWASVVEMRTHLTASPQPASGADADSVASSSDSAQAIPDSVEAVAGTGQAATDTVE